MITESDVYQASVGSLNLNIKVLREHFHLRMVELAPKPDSLLHLRSCPDATFRLPLDCVIAPCVIAEQAWDTTTIRLARMIIENRVPQAALVDVGANVGLFSRQMLNTSPEFQRAFLYEPHPRNFDCLLHNVAPFRNVQVNNDALGATGGVLNFYLDPDNSGNYSLNASAMPAGTDHGTLPVLVKPAAEEAQKWLSTNLPIFYKSDTQGFDEVIATSIDPAFWQRVFAGIFELWRIEKPSWSIERMAALLDSFPNKRFVQDPGTPVETADVFAYLAGTDGAFKDLLFWR